MKQEINIDIALKSLRDLEINDKILLDKIIKITDIFYKLGYKDGFLKKND